jgi:hypothetical protein
VPFNASALERIEATFRRRFNLFAGLASFTSAGLCLLVTKGSGFHSDDIWNLGQARDEGLTLDFLTHPVTEDHLAPGHRLVFWLVNALGPSWTLTVLLIVGLYAAMTLACAFAVREISGSSVMAIAAALLLASSVPFLRASMWLSSGAAEIPAAALILVTAWAVVRWTSDRRRRTLMLAGIGFVLALLFFEKYLVLTIPLLGLLLLARPAERTIRLPGLRQQLRSSLPMVVLVVAIATVVAALSARAASSNQSGTAKAATVTAGKWVELIVGWWQHGIGSMAINGNPVTTARLLNPDPAVDHLSFLGLVVLAALAALTIRGLRPGLIWVTALLTLLANGLLAGIGRVGQHGVDYVMDPRYHTTTLLTLILLIPAAWLASGRPRPSTNRATAILAAAAIVGASLWAINGAQTISNWHAVPHQSAAYAAKLRDSLAALTRRYPNASLVDEQAPEPVAVPLWVSKYGSTTGIAALLAPDIPVGSTHADGKILRISSDGVVRVVPTAGSVSLQPGIAGCGTTAAGTQLLEGSVPVAQTTIPRNSFAPGTPLLATIHFRANSSIGGMAIDPANGSLPLIARQLPDFSTGLQTLLPADVTAIRLLLWGGATGCVTGIDVTPLG